MNAFVSSLTASRPIDAELERIIEAAIGRLQDGEALDLGQLAVDHPQFAEQLRELLPTMEAMVRMGDAAGDLRSQAEADKGASPPLQQKQLGDFRLICELGRGGMGMVYEAEQLSMGRRVALKVLPFAALAQDKSLQRFRNEVRAAAALDHPHIVSVYSVGEERGVHYYAMQLIRGQTLADMIAELRKNRLGPASGTSATGADVPTIDSAMNPLPSTKRDEQARISTVVDSRQAAERCRSVARLGIQAAEALQHAHDQGVLHRDVKPGNLMVDAEAQLYVTDFGLARIEADAGMTMTGDLIGTLRYMAPEQALAKRVVIDHRADVYSLGATLYELLTLQPAFAETDRTVLLKQIAFEEPHPLRKLDRRIPGELETIVLKAMAKNPEERYQTAQLLADDLQAFLENRPIKAKPPTLVDRAAKWSRRHVAVVWSAAAILLIATVLMVVANFQIAKSYREAQMQEQSAKAVSGFLQQMLGSADPVHMKGSDYKVRQLLDDFSDTLGDQFIDQPQVEVALRTTVANAYRANGLLSRAEPHFERALELQRRVGGPDDVVVGDILTGYAWALYELGKTDAAFSTIEEALDIYRRNGSPREKMFPALTTLHTFLNWSARWKEAALIADEAVVIVGDQESADVSGIMSFASNLARSKLGQKEYPEAEIMARQALKLSRRFNGEQHPQTAWSWAMLGLTLRSQMKLTEAESAQREALAIFRQYYGREHKSIQVTLIRLACVLAAKGEVEEAKLARDEAIAGYEDAVKRGMTDAGCCNTLVTYLATDVSEVIRDGLRAIEIATKACEMSDYRDANVLAHLAEAYAEAGDFDAAVDWSEKALELADDENRAGLTERLESFRIRKPWRISF